MRKKLLSLSFLIAFLAIFQIQAQTNLISSWSGNGVTGTLSKPNDVGWFCTEGATPANMPWAVANSTGGCRFRDLTTGFTYETSGPTTHRQLMLRYDNASYVASNLGFPVTLAANTAYTLTFDYVCNVASRDLVVGISTTTVRSGRLSSKTVTTTASTTIYRKGTYNFTTGSSAGTYYMLFNNAISTNYWFGIANLSLIADPVISKDKTAFEFIPSIPSGILNVTASSLTSDLTLMVPSGISLSGANVTGTAPNYTILLANANASNSITVTWDASTEVNGNLTIASTGATTKTVSLIGSTAPGLLVTKTTIPLTTSTNTSTFDVTGSFLTEDIAILVPSNITLSGTNLTGTAPNYGIANANAGSTNTVTVTWDKALNASGTIALSSTGATTKNITISTDDVETATLSGITLSSGILNPTFASGTYTYSVKVPANVSSVTVTGTPTTSTASISNNGNSISSGTPSVTLGCTSYNSVNTNNYSVGFSNYILDDWDANGSIDATLSVPTVYGWNAIPTLGWGAANTGVGGTVRYMDITDGAGVALATYTYSASNYTGRILFQRWDGSASRVYSYPVRLEGCKSYNFTGKVAYNSVATAPTVTFRVNSANDNTGTTYASANVVTTTVGTLIDAAMSNFSVPTTGVYYITTTASTASLIGVADLAIAENTSESLGASPISLLLYAGNLSKTFTVSGNLLANDVSLSAPDGISLSAPGVTSGKDITILKADAQCGVIVTATWDNASAIVNLPIHVTSGAFSQDVTVYADKNDCSSPLYGDHTNLITEPFMNVLTSYTNSWGALSVATGAESYCGYGSAKLVGVNGASLTTPNIAWLANTKYRVRAMVKTTGGFQFGFQNTYAGTGATYEIIIPSTEGVWKQVDYIFTTGASAVAGFAFFNMQGRAGTLGYIDNWEIYDISDLVSEPDFAVKAWEQMIDQNITTTTFTVAPSARLTVNATRTLTATTLNLQSNPDGTATLLNSGTLSITTANVQQHMITGRNWYFSSPVTGATKSAVNATDVYRYNEPTSNWPTLAAEDVLAVGQGYVANPSGTGNATFTGAINDGTKDLNFTRTNAVAKSGFFLAGNPYPSYLSWLGATKTTMNPSVWYRSKHETINEYKFETYNSALNVGSDVSGRVPVTALIPPMQAFWVRVANGSETGSVQFTNAMRSHKDIVQNKFRSEAAQQVLRLRVSNGVNDDEAIVVFNSNASNGLDNYDSQKMSNSSLTIPEIFTIAGSEQLSINGMCEVTPNLEMPLGFLTKTANRFSIRASQISNFDAETRIVLNDKVLNQEFDLTDALSYSFTSEAINTTNRFSILFKSASGTTSLKNDVLADMKAFRNENNKIQINYVGSISKDASYRIYSINGQLISNGVITNATTEVAKSLNSGIYLVKLLNEGTVLTTKVLLF